MTDEYSASGEFLDILSRDAWAALREPVTTALEGADPTAGPLVDLGAGSGRGTRMLAELTPAATVLAVEPSLVQRAVLFARLADDSALADRVSLVSEPAETAPLPDAVGGILAMNMIGHLSPDDRRQLWRRLADRMGPEIPLVVNLQPPSRVEVIPDADFAAVRIGAHVYGGGGRAEPDGPDSVTWHMRYGVRDPKGNLVREVTAAYRWHVLDEQTLLAELAAVGLVAQPCGLGVYRASRAAG
ncbi:MULTISPECIES: class I SAM-dependent methyltransferase [unclassified Micromonospora]|uniref:class I SAM-dependent methyltransferase n=1 Tax=unclassified Micromonospora TaxID=2617518 RepID=UPI00362C9784